MKRSITPCICRATRDWRTKRGIRSTLACLESPRFSLLLIVNDPGVLKIGRAHKPQLWNIGRCSREIERTQYAFPRFSEIGQVKDVKRLCFDVHDLATDLLGRRGSGNTSCRPYIGSSCAHPARFETVLATLVSSSASLEPLGCYRHVFFTAQPVIRTRGLGNHSRGQDFLLGNDILKHTCADWCSL